jgi:hypothetical protein
MIEENPSVFRDWEEPAEITEHVNCTESVITHLSKHLIFSGKNPSGNAAVFDQCPNLKVATGTFHGAAFFTESGVETIDQLHVTEINDNKLCASFYKCKNLQVATGNYAGFVSFWKTGIHSIQNLHIQSDRIGHYAELSDCPNLHSLEGWDITKGCGIEPEKLESEKRRRKSLKKFIKNQTQELPFL